MLNRRVVYIRRSDSQVSISPIHRLPGSIHIETQINYTFLKPKTNRQNAFSLHRLRLVRQRRDGCTRARREGGSPVSARWLPCSGCEYLRFSQAVSLGGLANRYRTTVLLWKLRLLVCKYCLKPTGPSLRGSCAELFRTNAVFPTRVDLRSRQPEGTTQVNGER